MQRHEVRTIHGEPVDYEQTYQLLDGGLPSVYTHVEGKPVPVYDRPYSVINDEFERRRFMLWDTGEVGAKGEYRKSQVWGKRLPSLRLAIDRGAVYDIGSGGGRCAKDIARLKRRSYKGRQIPESGMVKAIDYAYGRVIQFPSVPADLWNLSYANDSWYDIRGVSVAACIVSFHALGLYGDPERSSELVTRLMAPSGWLFASQDPAWAGIPQTLSQSLMTSGQWNVYTHDTKHYRLIIAQKK